MDERLTSMLSKLHQEAQCCGINGWDDFNFNIEWGRAPANIHLTVPESCCVDQSEHALLECQIKGNQAFYHRKGCHEKIRDSIDSIRCDIKVLLQIFLKNSHSNHFFGKKLLSPRILHTFSRGRRRRDYLGKCDYFGDCDS